MAIFGVGVLSLGYSLHRTSDLHAKSMDYQRRWGKRPPQITEPQCGPPNPQNFSIQKFVFYGQSDAEKFADFKIRNLGNHLIINLILQFPIFISNKRRDLQSQRSRSQGYMTRLTGVGRQVENETSQKHQNWWEGCPPHGQQCLRFKVKGQGHIVNNTTQ